MDPNPICIIPCEVTSFWWPCLLVNSKDKGKRRDATNATAEDQQRNEPTIECIRKYIEYHRGFFLKS